MSPRWPIKTSSLLVMELDDSSKTSTKDEVAATVAAAGGCGVTDIRAGEIRPGSRGMGRVRLQCPAVAAEAVLKKGRLLIGFA